LLYSNPESFLNNKIPDFAKVVGNLSLF